MLKLDESKSHLTAQKNAELVFEKSGRQGELEEAGVTLKKGELHLSLSEGKQSRVRAGELELASSSGGQFELQKTADGYSVRARTGDAELKVNDATGKVLAGQLLVRAARCRWPS